MANNKHFIPERIDTQINGALEVEQAQLSSETDEYLVQRLNKHYQPGNEYDLALKRVQQRLAHFQSETASSDQQKQPHLPAQFNPGQFQTTHTRRTHGFIRPINLLAAVALCVLLLSGALILLSQVHSTLQCKPCLESHTQTPQASKTVQQYYGETMGFSHQGGSTTLYRFDPVSGTMLWHFTIPAIQDGDGVLSLAYIGDVYEANGILYFQSTGSDGYSIFALRASDGSLVWKYKYIPFITNPEIVLADGQIYVTSDVATGQSMITALNISTGQPTWSKTYSGLKMDGKNVSRETLIVAVAGNTLLATQSSINNQSSWNLYGLDAQTGETLWTKQLPTVMDQTPTAWQLVNGVLYLATTVSPWANPQKGVSYLYAFDTATGQTIWSKVLPVSVSQLQIEQNTIYLIGTCSSTSSILYALKTSDGSITWQRAQGIGSIGPDLTIADGEIYTIVSKDQNSPDMLLALRASDGHQDWQYTPDAKVKHLDLGTADENYFYMGDQGSTNILVLNRATGTLVKTIALKNGSSNTTQDENDTEVFSLTVDP